MANQTKQRKSRTEYSAMNAFTATTMRVLSLLAGYFARVVFTHTLSEDYVGINGIFYNILNILSVAELGIGTAISYALYKPIAEGDTEKQKSLMLVIKRMYSVLMIVIFAAGLCMLPFLKYLMKNSPDIEHVELLFIIYLVNCVISFIGVYKGILVDAYQFSYITVFYRTLSWIVGAVLQIVFLLLTRNFFAYALILLFGTILNNVCISIKANRLFPFLKEKNVEKLSKDEKSSILKNLKALLLHKVGNAAIEYSDNLLLSIIVGTVSVALYSNYYLIIASVRQLIEEVFKGIAASVGNLAATEDNARVQKIYEATFFAAQWIFGVSTVCMFVALDSFIGLSFGSNYIFAEEITIVLLANFFLLGMRQPTIVFRDSMGLFWYDRYVSVAEAIINLIASIVLGNMYGTLGIFLGTLISMVTTSLWIEPLILYKYKLKKSVFPYFAKFFLYTGVTTIIIVAERYTHRFFDRSSLWAVVLETIAVFILTNLIYLILYGRTKEFKVLKRKALSILLRKKQSKAAEELSIKEKEFLGLIKDYCDKEEITGLEASADNEAIRNLGRKHSVAHMIFDEKEAKKIVLQNYRLWFATRDTVSLLNNADIEVAVLKGAATAYYYKVPEMRKSGDIDIILANKSDEEKALDVLTHAGFRLLKEQVALHHKVLEKDGLSIELHSSLAEPFDNDRTNNYLSECERMLKDNIIKREYAGIELPVLNEGYHGYELILHMLQHFLREGFGIRLIVDWKMYLDREIDEEQKDLFLKLVTESRMKRFVDYVSETCVEYLGLEKEKTEWLNISDITNLEPFVLEIVSSGDFGKSDFNRMVKLRGNSVFDYYREFHHQTKLNYPRASKWIVTLPILWVMTFVRFVSNNKKIRDVRTIDILKNAREKSEIVKELKVFRE